MEETWAGERRRREDDERDLEMSEAWTGEEIAREPILGGGARAPHPPQDRGGRITCCKRFGIGCSDGWLLIACSILGGFLGPLWFIPMAIPWVLVYFKGVSAGMLCCKAKWRRVDDDSVPIEKIDAVIIYGAYLVLHLVSCGCMPIVDICVAMGNMMGDFRVVSEHLLKLETIDDDPERI